MNITNNGSVKSNQLSILLRMVAPFVQSRLDVTTRRNARWCADLVSYSMNLISGQKSLNFKVISRSSNYKI